MTISIIDICAVVIVLLVAFLSAKTGFFKVLINFAAYLAALFFSRMAASPVTSFVYSKFVQAKVTEQLSQVIPDGDAVVLTLKQLLPEKAAKIAEFFHFIPDESAAASINSALSVEKIENTFVSPVLMKILLIITTVLLFVVLSVLLRVLANALNNYLFKKKRGILSFTNKLLGFVFGILKSAVPVALICEVLNIAAPVWGNEFLLTSVSASYICNFIAGFIK